MCLVYFFFDEFGLFDRRNKGNIWMLLNKFRILGFLFLYLIINEKYRKREIVVKVYNYEYKVLVKIIVRLYLWVKCFG